MPCCKNSIKCGRGSVPVYLNVYDLTSMNGYAYWLGLGVYHSGVQVEGLSETVYLLSWVHGVEYAFGAHEYPTTGIFEGEPKKCEGFIFRKTLLIGWTEKTPGEVRGVMEELADKYKGIAYNLITKNCNHFCNDACIKLTSNPIPSWVNRLARIGFFCHCIIPMSLKSTKVRHHRMEDKANEGDSRKPQSSSNRQTPTSNPSPASSQSPPIAKSTSNKSKSPLPPSSPLISDSTTSSQSPIIAKSTSNKVTRPQPPSSLISETNSS